MATEANGNKPIVTSAAPVRYLLTDPAQPAPGIALCLSGGGYRAMLFHLGSLWRLNDAGLLKKLNRVSSVSGGSITAAMLGLSWPKLAFDPASGVAQKFQEEVVVPIRRLAGKTIDVRSILSGLLLPGSIGSKIAGAYRKFLFHDATLQDLPDDSEGPRFILNAANVQTGSLWRFSKPYMGDYRVGLVDKPTVPLAVAVAASSAFPPFLSPLVLPVAASAYCETEGTDLGHPPYTTNVVLTDGGVYDNLGLETAWKNYRTILVSDAGQKMAPDPEPKKDWFRHVIRVLNLLDNQVRSLRKRQLIDSYKKKERTGAYWGIVTDIQDYGLRDALDCPVTRTTQLAAVSTRLKRLPDCLQARLINWGYAVCDAALRAYCREVLQTEFNVTLHVPAGFPYRDAGV
jgi:NTE family protein